MGMAIPILQSSVGGWGLGSLIPQTISQGFSFVGHKKFRLQCRKTKVVRGVWSTECFSLLGSDIVISS